jgi:hypothetical protein
VKTMAEVLAEHADFDFDPDTYPAMICICGTKFPWLSEAESGQEAFVIHQAAALSAAGFGPVQEAKAQALREAADDPVLRLSGHSGISITRLRTRAEQLTT